jgi:hypothetical protein
MAVLGLGVLLFYTLECVAVIVHHSILMGYLALSAFIHFYEHRIFVFSHRVF